MRLTNKYRIIFALLAIVITYYWGSKEHQTAISQSTTSRQNSDFALPRYEYCTFECWYDYRDESRNHFTLSHAGSSGVRVRGWEEFMRSIGMDENLKHDFYVLNKLGEDGWELVDVTDTLRFSVHVNGSDDRRHIFYFRRPIH